MISKIISLYEDRKWLVIYTFCSIALLYFVFAPAVNFLYYGGDDMRYSFGNPSLACSYDDGYYFMLALGRPLQAWLDCQSFKYAYTVERMQTVRLIAVVLMGCTVGLLADWLRMYRVTLLQGFLIATALILVPHIYGDTILTGALSLPVAILLSVIAYRFVIVAKTSDQSRRYEFAAVVSLIIAMLSYPAMTFIYCALVLVNMLLSQAQMWEKTRRQLFVQIRVFVIAAALFFIWAYFNMHYNSFHDVPREYRLDKPNFNPIEMFGRLLLLVDVFNPKVWVLLPQTPIIKQANWLLALIVGGITITAVRLYRFPNAKRLTTLLQIVTYFIVILLLCSAFSLLIPRTNFGSRLLVGTVVSGVALAIWGLFQWASLVPVSKRHMFVTGSLIAYVFLQASQANFNTMYGALMFVTYSNNTAAIVRNYFVDHKELKRIQFIIPPQQAPYTQFFHANVVLAAATGSNSYTVKWCSATRDGRIPDIAQKKKVSSCLAHLPARTVGITFSFKGQPYFKTNDMLVIEEQFDATSVSKWLMYY